MIEAFKYEAQSSASYIGHGFTKMADTITDHFDSLDMDRLIREVDRISGHIGKLKAALESEKGARIKGKA